MTEKIYLETLKSVLGRSVFHYYIHRKTTENNNFLVNPSLPYKKQQCQQNCGN